MKFFPSIPMTPYGRNDTGLEHEWRERVRDNEDEYEDDTDQEILIVGTRKEDLIGPPFLLY